MEERWIIEYVDSVEQLKFSDNQKNDLAEKIVRKSHETSQGNVFASQIHISLKKMALVGVCACMLFSVIGISAATNWEIIPEWFSLFFSSDDVGALEEMGIGLDEADTSNGVMISADGAAGDQHHCILSYKIEWEDEKLWDYSKLNVLENGQISNIGFENFEMNMVENASGSLYFYDENLEDRELQMCITVSADDEIRGKSLKFSFEDFTYANEKGEILTFFEGRWDLCLELLYEDTSVIIASNEKIVLEEDILEVDEMIVSELGFHISYRLSDESQVDIRNIPVILYLKNGEELIFTGRTGYSKEVGWKEITGTYAMMFDRIVRIEEMDTFLVGNRKFEITLVK